MPCLFEKGNEMKDNAKVQKKLNKELTQLRRRLAELEAAGRKRNQLEEAVRTERDKAQHYLDIAEVMLVALNKKGEITLINRKGKQLLGYKGGELLGKNWFTTCLPSPFRKDVKGVFLKLMEGKGRITEFYENPVLTKSGTERIIAWHNTVLKDEQGKNIGTLSSGEDITERKQAADALKETEKKYRQVVENATDIIYTTDINGNFKYANPTALKVVGYSLEELQRFNYLDLVVPEYRDPLKEIYDKQFRGRQATTYVEFPFFNKFGEVMWFGQNASLMIEGSRIIGFQVIARDITERRRMEEALRESEEKYRLSFMNVSDVVYTLDSNLMVSSISPSVERALGYKVEEVMNKPFHELNILSSEFLEKAYSDVMRVFSGEQIPASIYEFIAKDGTRKIGEVSGSPLYRNGKIVGLISVARDITERKQAEEALRESETRFRTLFEAIPDTVLVHDDEGTILHINEIGAHRLEWSAKDLVGKNLRAIVTLENRASIADHIKEARKVGWSRFETTYVSRSGWQIMAEVNERPIKFGKEKAILSVARDITERKEAERALIREKNFSNAVINSSPGLMFVFGEKGNIIQWNSNAENVTGYSASEIAKMNVLEFVAEEDIETAARGVQDALTKGQASVEIDILTKSGKKTPFYIIGLRTKIENANCVVCTGIDITERKQAEEEVKRGYEQLHETFISTVNALASTVEMKDQYTAGHQPRVTQLACAIAKEMGLSVEQIEGIRMAASIHDIGKVIVPAEILSKPGPLTEIQFEMIKMHPQAGYDILKGIKFPWPVAQIILQHHELMDGSGYPRGLSGEEIMVEARILTVADVIEAMNSHRPYRPAFDMKVALEEISQNRGTFYDPEVVDACIRLFTEKAFTFS